MTALTLSSIPLEWEFQTRTGKPWKMDGEIELLFSRLGEIVGAALAAAKARGAVEIEVRVLPCR